MSERQSIRPPESPFLEEVLAALHRLEPGDVVTYGEIAAEAGRPAAARAGGNILRDSEGVPWWRVVTASGRLVPGHEDEQAARLRTEGIPVRNGRIEWSRRARIGHTSPKEEHGA